MEDSNKWCLAAAGLQRCLHIRQYYAASPVETWTIRALSIAATHYAKVMTEQCHEIRLQLHTTITRSVADTTTKNLSKSMLTEQV